MEKQIADSHDRPLVRVSLLWIGMMTALLALVAGCGGDENSSGEQDAALSDADLHDGSNDDASSDEDNDEDGYPASQDCDDDDPSVYPEVTVECTSECNFGVQMCREDGTWTTCTADTDCDCSEPGTSRIIDCGNCGWASQLCGSDSRWDLPNECLDEGDCSPGLSEEAPCDLCGSRVRYCNQDCTWRDWDDSGCYGECTPGETKCSIDSCPTLGEIQDVACNDDCAWEPTTACTADCPLTPRNGNNDFKDEVCIPGGAFLMGSTEPDAYEEDKPQRTVYLTPYFIDVYEVTNARYIECVNAGACTPPPSYTRYDEPDMQDHPVIQVTYYQAMEFCQWDGGRTLPTEAQWEKAAKGPAPEDPRHPWGDQEPNCSLAVGRDCHNDTCMTASVDNCPSGVSFYGVYGMAANASEWCWDYYDADYYSTGPDFDPTGPSSGLERSRRGWEGCRYFEYWLSSTASRLWQEPTEIATSFMTGFRCARRGY